jgi:tricorn protease-like protein
MKYAVEMGSSDIDKHTEFRKYWFRRSKVDEEGIYRHIDNIEN